MKEESSSFNPTSNVFTHSPSTTSQTLTVSSSHALARYRLSGEKHTACTQPLWPRNTCRRLPLRGFHSLIVLSQDPDAYRTFTLSLLWHNWETEEAWKFISMALTTVRSQDELSIHSVSTFYPVLGSFDWRKEKVGENTSALHLVPTMHATTRYIPTAQQNLSHPLFWPIYLPACLLWKTPQCEYSHNVLSKLTAHHLSSSTVELFYPKIQSPVTITHAYSPLWPVKH